MNVEDITGRELSFEELDAVAGGFLGIHINFKKIFHDVGKDLGKVANWIEHHPTVVALAVAAIAEA